jgi:hypothetical protein
MGKRTPYINEESVCGVPEVRSEIGPSGLEGF